MIDEYILQFTPDIEIYSIDEAFLLLSIGIAPTKALAKVGNKIAKKFLDGTGGVYIAKKNN